MESDREQWEAAYLYTDYRVDDAPNGPFVIRLGELSIDLEELLRDECEFTWAFVTACNPGSVAQLEEVNLRRAAELQSCVRKRHWRYFVGSGVGRDGQWPAEPSLLILGIRAEDAIELARRFGQNALVVGAAGERARLVWID